MRSITFTKYQHNSFLRLISKIVSYVFHPLFMPTMMALLLFYISKSSFVGIEDKVKFNWAIIIGINTMFFPALTVFLLKKLGFIQSIHLKTMRERIIPLIATMVFYFWAYQVFKSFNSPFILRVFLLGCFWGIIAVFMANIFTKISMHTAAAGGVIGILIVLLIIGQTNFLIPFLIVLLIAGLIGTARMILLEHTPIEIWMGYIVGIGVQLGAYWFLV